MGVECNTSWLSWKVGRFPVAMMGKTFTIRAAYDVMAQDISDQIDRDVLETILAETLNEQVKIEQERVKQDSTIGKKLVDLF